MDYAKVSNCILVEISIVFFLLIKKYKSPNELVLFMAHFDTSKLSIPASFFLGGTDASLVVKFLP